jgi:hypothetical protein
MAIAAAATDTAHRLQIISFPTTNVAQPAEVKMAWHQNDSVAVPGAMLFI